MQNQAWNLAILPIVKVETLAMARVPRKIDRFKPTANKADMQENLTDLLAILADLNKLLREDALAPKYKH